MAPGLINRDSNTVGQIQTAAARYHWQPQFLVVRKAIENSFIKKMEESAVIESETKESMKDDRNSKSEDESAKTERSSSNTDKSEESRSQQSQSNPAPKRSRKSKAPCVPSLKKKELPDMINE